MRTFLTLLLCVSFFGLNGCSDPAGHDGSPNTGRPNIVLISSDTLRSDRLGVNGYDRALTPNIDRFAAQGVNFTRAYSHAPNTAPSHTSLLTSMYPSVHGVFEHGQTVDPAVETLAEALQQAGYTTAGFTQLNGPSYQQGFDLWERLDRDNLGRGAQSFEQALDWVAKTADTPFFLFVHSYNVHLPYNPPSEWRSDWAGGYTGSLGTIISRADVDAINEDVPASDPADRQYVVDMYDAEVAYYDHLLGEMLDGFRRLRLWDDTIFVFFSDHGEEFGEHGNWGRHTYSLYEELIRVPLVIVGPGVPQGVVSDAEVQLIDVAPTLMKLVGVESPTGFMGKNLAPAWSDRQRRPRIVVAEKKRQRVMIWAGFKYYSDGRLYDLETDPLEEHDIAADDAETAGRMKRAMVDWLGEVVERAEGLQRTDEIRLTPAEERRLRALGYLQ